MVCSVSGAELRVEDRKDAEIQSLLHILLLLLVSNGYFGRLFLLGLASVWCRQQRCFHSGDHILANFANV